MRIGVLGGGQLGRMLGLAGIPLGLNFRFLDPVPSPPSAAVGEIITGNFDDPEALKRFAEGLDVITYEFENVPATSLDILAGLLPIRPGRLALEVSQDRVTEKTFFGEANVPCGPWKQVDSLSDLQSAHKQFGECIVKTRRFGYDGKGQFRLQHANQCEEAWQTLGQSNLIAEQLVPFDRELSLVGVRGTHGDIKTWPLVENVHRKGILHKTTAPASEIPEHLQRKADTMLTSLMERLDYIGVLTIELFQVNGDLLANEFAPRVHNSGHWTIEGSVTSQFENHIRAVAGLPLGSTALLSSSVMLNCIGSMPKPDRILSIEGAHLHDYGKSSRTGRKVGHITVCDELKTGASMIDKITFLESLVEESATVANHG